MSAFRGEKEERKLFSRLDRAVKQHEARLHDGKISLPAELGKLVIVVSNNFVTGGQIPVDTQRKAFHDEADELAERHRREYADVEIRRKAIRHEIGFDLADKEVSGMVLIGHGNIGDFWLDDMDNSHLDWRNVAKHSRHVMQGRFEQRMCGHFIGIHSVPLGTFAVADQRRVIAPVGIQIDDVDPDESVFQPVYGQPFNSTEDIRGLVDYYWTLENEELVEEQ